MEVKRLLFVNPIFQMGLNVTVRRGHDRDVVPGEVIDLLDAEGVHCDSGWCVAVRETTLNAITRFELRFEHDPQYRRLEALNAEMKSIYPEIVSDSPVSLIWFWV